MVVLGVLLFVVGMIIGFIGGLWLLVLAFQESIFWGLGSLFLPFVSLIFVIMHWDTAKKPFLIWLASIPLWLIGAMIMLPSANAATLILP